MKIVTVIGARPQFIKAAAVNRAIAEYNSTIHDERLAINEVIVHTGQHFDENMSDVFFEEMQIRKPNYFLDINSMNHGAMTGRMLEKIEEVLLKEKPDFVLVYGDTNSTLAGALAAKKLQIKVVHVEAGLRSFNMRMPEEINRILTDRISDILCCPTDTAVGNLQKEGFRLPSDPLIASNDPTVVYTGDVMLDAALYYSSFSADHSTIISKLALPGQVFALCTIHRAENTDDPERLAGIFTAINEISKEMKVVLPIHPRTQKIIATMGFLPELNKQNVLVVPPVGYFDMIELLKHTRIVLTDSGGLQKEAFFFRKPCVTLRDETEWVELVSQRVNVLAGANMAKIISSTRDKGLFADIFNLDIYGNGQASSNIISSIIGCYENIPG